MTAFPLVTAA